MTALALFALFLFAIADLGAARLPHLPRWILIAVGLVASLRVGAHIDRS